MEENFQLQANSVLPCPYRGWSWTAPREEFARAVWVRPGARTLAPRPRDSGHPGSVGYGPSTQPQCDKLGWSILIVILSFGVLFLSRMTLFPLNFCWRTSNLKSVIFSRKYQCFIFNWDTAFPLAYIHIIKNIPRQSTTIWGPVKAKKMENNYARLSSEIKISFYSKISLVSERC